MYSSFSQFIQSWQKWHYWHQRILTTAVGLDLMQEIIAGLGVQCLTILAKQACAIYGIFKLLFMHHLIFGLRGTERI